MPGVEDQSREHSSGPAAAGGPLDADPAGHLAEHLAERLAEFMAPSTAIVCIGNDLCGDDGAGVEVARQLAGTVGWRIFNAQMVPESFLMKIVDQKPASLVLVDAVHMAAPPGTVRMLQADQIGAHSPSTHGPAPLAFLEMLAMLHACPCAVMAIQPKQCGFDQPLSEPVRQGVDRVVRAFQLLSRRRPV